MDARGFDYVVDKEYKKAAPGTVLSVTPKAGSEVTEGTKVQLTVAKPVPVLPDVVGLSQKDALRELREMDYRVDTRIVFSSQARGQVLEESPQPGTERLPGQEVNLTLASGCDANYSGCLNPLASDYDCAGGTGDGPLYTGYVRVTGIDTFDLDSDSDGIGCES